MKNSLRLCYVALLCFVATCICLPSVQVQAQSANPIYLKVNDFFILYTYPASPFVDQNGRILIPLKAAEDILGGKVTYNAASKTASVDLLDRKVTAAIGSREILVNGKPVMMDTVPVMKSNAMFLPISVLIKDTEAEMKWDAKRGLMKLKHDSFAKGPALSNFLGQDLAQVMNANAFDLSSFEWDKRKGTLRIHATFESSLSPAYKQIDFNPLIVYSNGGFSVNPYSRPSNYYKVNIVSPGELVYTREIDTKQNISYIISVGRLIQ